MAEVPPALGTVTASTQPCRALPALLCHTRTPSSELSLNQYKLRAFSRPGDVPKGHVLPQGQETRPAEPVLPVPSCSDAHLGTACLAQLSLCPSHSLKPTESSFAAYFLMDIPTAPERDSLLPRSPAPTPQPRRCLPGAVVDAEPCSTLRSTHSSVPSPQASSGYNTQPQALHPTAPQPICALRAQSQSRP